jgi:hypothetical protein
MRLVGAFCEAQAMPDILIGSDAEGLSLSPDPSTGAPESLVATLRLDGLVATRQVVHNYASGFQDLAVSFAELAGDWRGWSGARLWASLEGDLRISATHAHSHVTLKVELRHDKFDWDNDGWRVVGDIAIEPGEQLARAATDLALLARG